MGDDHHKVVAFYEKFGASAESVAKAILAAIDRPRLIVPAPRSHVTLPYLLHRLSPRLAQPLARRMTKLVSRGAKPRTDAVAR